ncbi:2TM domain-containing protein [Planctomicrobium sp. SH668]|uniref:2TM domain-containing protein n=1 Tax=Planctomicrobium sp. SH668 TaxID=3448126 RepID=UPI003F5C4DA8
MNEQRQMTQEQAELRAQQIFYVHAGVYAGVNAMLAYTNLTRTPDKLWFQWPLAGWGAGLAAHAIGVFVTHRAADRVMKRVARRQERRENRASRRGLHSEHRVN